MGIVYAELQLSNPAQPTLKPVNVTATVDTGAMTLCIPEHVATQLKFLPEQVCNLLPRGAG
jgi:hypothetical protein